MQLPSRAVGPARAVTRRLFLALALIALTAGVVYVDRDGYEDATGGDIGLADSFYYATVSVTTTGYGDITPVTARARAVTTILVTPVRVLFLIRLVGTTVEVLTEQSRTALRVLDVGAGIDIIECPVSAEEHGGPPQPRSGELVVAVVRSDELLRFDDPRVLRLDAGDEIVAICTHRPTG